MHAQVVVRPSWTSGRAGRFYRHSFRRALALIYTAGTVAHLLRLIYRFELSQMPFFPDWILVIVGPYVALGMILFAGEVRYRGRWEVWTHWLITAHLLVSIGLHLWILVTHSHGVLSVFGYSYSYFAALYFSFFAWRSWTMCLEPNLRGIPMQTPGHGR